MRVLIVEDEERLLNAIPKRLKAASFTVDSSSDGLHEPEIPKQFEYGAIILDSILQKLPL